jgi:predicted Mrr-cat superfamily restriction endonuclease
LTRTRILLVRAGHGNELLDDFIRLGIVAVGWGKLGDLSFTSADTLKSMLWEHHLEGVKLSGELYKHLAEIIHFAVEAKTGDLVATFNVNTHA